MRIIFVLTYPVYHGIADLSEWLRWDNRDRRMPGLLAAQGVDVELWGVGHERLDLISDLNEFRAILERRGFSEDDLAGIFHQNFLDFLKKAWT